MKTARKHMWKSMITKKSPPPCTLNKAYTKELELLAFTLLTEIDFEGK